MEEEGDLELLVLCKNGVRESELQEQIFVMPNCSKLEEGVFIASGQNPTVGHLSSSAPVEDAGRPGEAPDHPAWGPVGPGWAPGQPAGAGFDTGTTPGAFC